MSARAKNPRSRAMSARAKSPAAATRPAPKARSGAENAPERSEWRRLGSAQGGIYR